MKENKQLKLKDRDLIVIRPFDRSSLKKEEEKEGDTAFSEMFREARSRP